MKAVILENYQLAFLNCATLILFFAFFVGMLFWIFRKSSTEFYDYMKHMPLKD